MARPIWETPYNIGTFYSNIPINIQLLAVPVTPATSVTYNQTGGSLPNGLILYSDGYIRGSIVNPSTNSSFSTTIIVQAVDNLGNTASKTFLLNFQNTLTQPNWNTNSGTLGVFPALIPATVQLSATPVLPAVSLTYAIISGNLPNGLTLSVDGLISGIPSVVSQDTTNTFVVRVTDNYDNIRDRTFSLTVTGNAVPEITTPPGNLLNTFDSVWVELPLQYSNPLTSNNVRLRVIQGALPPGLEINDFGVIRGYAQPPTYQINLPLLNTSVVAVTNNVITALTTAGFVNTRPIVFSGTSFGGIEVGKVYYVKNIISNTQFTISSTVNGETILLNNSTGFMNVELPIVVINQPTKKTFSFTVAIESNLGGNSVGYNIVVTNQNLPTNQGGPGYPTNTRKPTIFNTQPPTYNIGFGPNFGYYILPPNGNGLTYQPSIQAPIGQLESDNYFSFKILGFDFDGNPLTYIFNDLPLGLVGDSVTGYITGTPVISDNSISQYSFSVYVSKTVNPSIRSDIINFNLKLANNITDIVIWNTDSDLGSILNGSISSLRVEAIADTALLYRISDGTLPPNLSLLQNGEITGQTAWQPGDNFLNPGTTTEFTFEIEAYSPLYSIISSKKTFTVTVINEFNTPSETLYIQAAPSLADRDLLRTLLDNELLIPYDYLYRPTDPSFGKASSIIYAHAYGINASSFAQYIEAVTKNHYWRNITLGSLSTAVARDENGEIIYEVVYSNVIDNLINPQGVSISEEIIWPRLINLSLGPWYTSSTNIYTSYVFTSSEENLITEDGIDLITENNVTLTTEAGQATFYTSLTPGYARLLYPNSLPNMRNRVGQVLGVQDDYRLLPKWMISQQNNGSTLGFIPAWVICYTKPGYSEIIKNNIENNWKNPAGQNLYLNQIDFKIDRFTVDKSATYNYDNNTSPPSWLTYPSAEPVPDPTNSKDFYVLFPRETILPTNTQYN